jgi:LysR family glycine cleavage system transcriptional activator
LNDVGLKLHRQVQHSLGSLSRSLAEAQSAAVSDKISIASSPEFAEQWLLPKLASLGSSLPSLEVSVVKTYRQPLFYKQQVDFAVTLGTGGAGVHADRITDDDEFPVCSPDVARLLPTREGFRTQPLLRYRGARHTLLDWQRWMEKMGIEEAESYLDKPLSFETFRDMIQACQRGEGLALVRTSLVEYDLKTGSLVRPFEELLPADFQYHLICPVTALDRPKIKLFREWVISQVPRAANRVPPKHPIASNA